MPKKSSSKKTSRKTLKNKLDKLWSEAIRKRDKKCQRCGTTQGLQAAHIFTRSALSTRWDLRNGIGLCSGCHIYWWHKEPIEATRWIEERNGKKEVTSLLRKRWTIKKYTDQELELMVVGLEEFINTLD